MKAFQIPTRLLFALLAYVCAHPPAAVAAERPNIIVILADDMGYSDIGCYGAEIATPNLDSLAKGGVRFTQFYNTARCCPTRASLLTGLHPHQAGIGHMMDDDGLEGYRGTLNRRCVTIAEALKPAGYHSYAVGKWHVSPGQNAKQLANTSNWPLQRGFERYYGTIHGAGSYWDPSALVRDNKQITAANDPEYRPAEFYYTDAVSEHAVRFIRDHARDHAQEPFFLYVAYTAAHWPMHAKEADIAKYRGRYDAGFGVIRDARWARQQQLGVVDAKWRSSPLVGDWSNVKDKAFDARCMEVYAAMIDCMDQGIGRVVAELKERGQLDNTLILYLQDNGACAETVGRGPKAEPRGAQPTLPVMSPDAFQVNSTPKQTRDGWPVRQGYGVMPGGPDTYVAYGRDWANVSNTPFREYKHWVHEGGISTPFIAHWPAGIAEANNGRIEKQPGQLPDIMATVLDVSGAKYPAERDGQAITPPEGVSLRPAFSGQPLGRTRPLVWEHEGNRAIREGDWKLVAKGLHAPWELYDLAADRTELHDLAAAEPARVVALGAQWDAWAKRANVWPSPLDKAAGTRSKGGPTHFDLAPDANLPGDEAPDYTSRAFTVTVTLAEPGTDGMLVAQGGSNHGWALFLEAGKLHFVINRGGKVEEFTSPEKLADAKSIAVRLAADRTLTLLADGRELLKQQAGPLPQTFPIDGLQVGRDLGGTVGKYKAPFAFTGKISRAVIDLSPR